MEFDLAFIWAILIAVAVLLYVVLDGFDLGVGILFPLFKEREDRDVMMNTIAPVWDGNETWLILGGGGLFAAFPLAYATLLPAFYAPIIAMLLGLIFRGVAFEYCAKASDEDRHWWEWSFTAGSTIAAFCQGLMLGAFIQGIEVTGRDYSGGWFDWFTPFSATVGLAVVAAYALLGACWLIMKTEGELQYDMYRVTMPIATIVFAFVGLVSLWTPFLDTDIADRWFTWPNIAFVAPVPILVLACWAVLFTSIKRKHEYYPFLSTLGLFILSYVGFAISMFPYIVPRHFTIWQAANPPESLSFLLYGTLALLPVILGYTAYVYWVFRGKVTKHDGYH
ncbi:MAG: cytochrome d ubiquinol oxidase subunit II [Rhizobiales bacterium]|nr:cytochrome d ubiquinol oxidase subunit II [Hyphomicrobiales bacterium]